MRSKKIERNTNMENTFETILEWEIVFPITIVWTKTLCKQYHGHFFAY